MKSLLFACCLVFLAAISAPTVNADVALPKPSEKPGKVVLHTSLEIATDARASEARLRISESSLKSLRAALDGRADSNTPVAASIAQSSTRTIIAGLLMFLSVSIAGVLFARSSFSRTHKVAGAVILVAAMIGAAAIITRGNAGPPGSYQWRSLPQALAQGKSTAGGVDIEIVPDDAMTSTGMKLILPLKKQNSKGEE